MILTWVIDTERDFLPGVCLTSATALVADFKPGLHPAAALRAPDPSFVIPAMTSMTPRLAFPQVRPNFIRVTVVPRVMGRVGRLTATASTELSLAPFLDLRPALRIAFPLPVLCLPVLDPDIVWALAAIGGDHNPASANA